MAATLMGDGWGPRESATQGSQGGKQESTGCPLDRTGVARRILMGTGDPLVATCKPHHTILSCERERERETDNANLV